MKVVPFQELYNAEFFICESLAKGQNWYTRGNCYSCIGKPKPSHTFLWFKNSRGRITDLSGSAITIEKNQIAYMSKGIQYIVEFFDTLPDQDDTVVFHFQLFDNKHKEIAPTLSPTICIKNADTPLALMMSAAADEFNKNIPCTPVITATIYQLLATACQMQRKRVVSNKYKHIREGIELMESNSEKPLSEIAAICGVSEGHFRKLFHEYSGENPVEFRQKYRIEKAKQLLMLDTHSIGEIAEELHFSDIYHFSKVFKKYTGVSPRKYMELSMGEKK